MVESNLTGLLRFFMHLAYFRAYVTDISRKEASLLHRLWFRRQAQGPESHHALEGVMAPLVGSRTFEGHGGRFRGCAVGSSCQGSTHGTRLRLAPLQSEAASLGQPPCARAALHACSFVVFLRHV